MSEKTINKVPNVPNLRFFNDDNTWSNSSLEKKCKFVGGGTPSTLNQDYWNGDIAWISSADLLEENVHKYNVSRFITKEAIMNSATKICPINTIMIVSRVGVGKIAISNSEICTSQDFTNLTEYQFDKNFLVYSLKNTIEKLKNSSQGTSIKGITSKEIKQINIFYPEIIEQCEIGLFFKKIDERIESQSKIIKEYKSYRNRILHTIYNDLNDFDYISLNQLCSITTGKLDANAMNPNGKYKFFTCAKEDYYIDKYSFEGESLIISGNGEVGLIKYFNGKFDAYQRTYVLQNFIKNPLYIKFALEIELPKKLHREKNVGAMPYIVLSTLTGIKVKIPNKDLISKITLIVTSLDKKIAIEEQILNDYLLQKKYLLANMFI